MKKKTCFKRSAEENAVYYSKKSFAFKLKETVELSDFSLNFKKSYQRAKFNG